MNELISFIMGMIVGMFLTSAILSGQIKLGNEAIDSIKECQQELPRNQHCTIKAVVAEEK